MRILALELGKHKSVAGDDETETTASVREGADHYAVLVVIVVPTPFVLAWRCHLFFGGSSADDPKNFWMATRIGQSASQRARKRSSEKTNKLSVVLLDQTGLIGNLIAGIPRKEHICPKCPSFLRKKTPRRRESAQAIGLFRIR